MRKLIAIALCAVLASTAPSFAAEIKKASAADIAAMTAAVKGRAGNDPVESVFVNKVVDEFAEATVSVKDTDGLIAYLKKDGAHWVVIYYGAGATEEELLKLGVRADVAKKFLE